MTSNSLRTAILRDRIFINGEWVASQGTGSISVTDSNTGTVMGSVPHGNARDVEAAVAAAASASDSWSATPFRERAEWIRKVGQGLQRRSAELTDLIAREVGMPIGTAARLQVGLPVAQWGSYADLAQTFEFEETVGNSVVVREPVGVVAAITPWNFPLNQISLKVAPALLAGCTVVLKPSEVAPFNAFVLAEVMGEVGLPAGVFNLVCGDGVEVGEPLVTHPSVACVSFTGSTRAGKRIAELASAGVKRVRLELGGKSASVLLASADFSVAVPASTASCFMNSGQTCVAQTRLLVPRSRLAEAAAIAKEVAQSYTLGSAFRDGVRLGPLVSKLQLERVCKLIQQGIEGGARLITGGADAPDGLEGGFFVQPTVFVVEDPTSVLACEEIFGPVLAIIPYEDEADAIRIANDTPYGLGGAVWAATDEEAVRVARRIRTGQIHVNGGPFNPAAPFGGFRQSGYGREGGRFGLEEFLEYKAIHMRAAT